MQVDLSGIDTSQVVAQLELLDHLIGDAIAGCCTKIDVHERHLLQGMEAILRRVSGDDDSEPGDEPTLREKGEDLVAAARAMDRPDEDEPDDPVLIALVLLVTNPGVRAHLERHDPRLLRQARNAMFVATGLKPISEEGGDPTSSA